MFLCCEGGFFVFVLSNRKSRAGGRRALSALFNGEKTMPIIVNIAGNIVTDADKAAAKRSVEDALRPFINGTTLSFSWDFVPRQSGVNPIQVRVPGLGIPNSREEEVRLAVREAICHYGRVSVIIS